MVMVRIGCRTARAGLSTWTHTEAERKAEDRPLRLVHRSVRIDESVLSEATSPTGKRSARKRACSVWSGGKAATPDLLLPRMHDIIAQYVAQLQEMSYAYGTDVR